MTIPRIATSFFFVFEALTFVAERIHAIEFLNGLVERLDLPPESVDVIADLVIATIALAICLRIARWFEIRRLVADVEWRKGGEDASSSAGEALKRYANRVSFRLNLRAIGVFLASAPILEIVAKVAIIARSTDTMVHATGPLGAVALRFWQPLALSLLVWGSIVLARRLWLARVQDIDLPGDDDVDLGDLIDERDLVFRHVRNDPLDYTHSKAAVDIKRLATTETYGAMGDTDFKQVFAWWTIYPRGNWLAVYRGDVVGGVDIWPIRKAVYEGLRSGELGEENIDTSSLAPRPDSADGSYWYVASISLALPLRQQRFRRAVLAKLIETAMEQNFLASQPAFPARIIALIWTPQGRNIARRNDFRYVGKREGHHDAAEPIYEIVFHDEAAVRRMVAGIKLRLARRAAPVAAAPNAGVGLAARPLAG